VNTLMARQQDLSPVFAGLTEHTAEQRFDSGHWYKLVTGAPVLTGAAVAFDCRVTQRVEVGTHDVFFCEVEGIAEGDLHEGLMGAHISA
jgi:flavin reductase